MAKPKAPTKKDPFEKLDKELKAFMENASDEDLKKKVSEVALYRQARQDAKKADPELKQLREKLAFEASDYNEEIKGADLQIKYAHFLLEARGKA